MVRLARVEYLGDTLLAAQLKDGDEYEYCDLSSVAKGAPEFFGLSRELRQAANDLIRKAHRHHRSTNNSSSSSSSSNNHKNDKDGYGHLRIIPAAHCKLLAPLDKFQVGKFVGIGMNYVDHCKEQNVAIPKEPMVFSKFGSCIAGTGDPIPTSADLTTKLDYEAELGVIVGKAVPRNATLEVARRCIGGFTVVHDVSARDWQLERNGGQWLLGKAGDAYAPIGPVIVTADELPLETIQNSGIRCRVNGRLLQDSNTRNLVHKVDGIISFLSKFMTLYPGDVIATGTPPGVGCFRKPQRWLKPGDVVECEIDGIGSIANPVVHHDDHHHRHHEDEDGPSSLVSHQDPSSEISVMADRRSKL